MPDHDRDQTERGTPLKGGPQSDPMLNEGRASGPRTWGTAAVIAAVVLAVMYGITTHRAEVQDEHRQAEIKQEGLPSANAPGQALPGGRNTSDAPANPAVTKPGQ